MEPHRPPQTTHETREGGSSLQTTKGGVNLGLEEFQNQKEEKQTTQGKPVKLKRNNWKVTEKDNVIVKLKVKDGDEEIPYGLFVQKVTIRKTGNPMFLMKLCRLLYNKTDKQFQYDFNSAIPTWFTPQDYIDFVQALGEL